MGWWLLLGTSRKTGCIKPLRGPRVPHLSAETAWIAGSCLMDGRSCVWIKEAVCLWILYSMGLSFSLAGFLISQYSRPLWWVGWTIWVHRESPQEFDPARYFLTNSSSSTWGSSSNSRCWGWVVADRRKAAAAGGGLPSAAYLCPSVSGRMSLCWGLSLVFC